MPEYPIATVIREFSCPDYTDPGAPFTVSGRLCIPGVSYPNEGYPNQDVRLFIDGVLVATVRTWDAYTEPHENIGLFSFEVSIEEEGPHGITAFYPGKPHVEDRLEGGTVFYLESDATANIQVGTSPPPPDDGGDGGLNPLAIGIVAFLGMVFIGGLGAKK